MSLQLLLSLLLFANPSRRNFICSTEDVHSILPYMSLQHKRVHMYPRREYDTLFAGGRATSAVGRSQDATSRSRGERQSHGLGDTGEYEYATRPKQNKQDRQTDELDAGTSS